MSEAEFYARLARETPGLVMAWVPFIAWVSVMSFVLGVVGTTIFNVGVYLGDVAFARAMSLWRPHKYRKDAGKPG